MSLLCRLPLTNSLVNYGLSDVAITENNISINSNGKVGECYQFGSTTHNSHLVAQNGSFIQNSSGDYIELTHTQSATGSYVSIDPSIASAYSGDFSFTLWLYIDSFVSNWDTFVYAGQGSTAWGQYVFGLLRNNATSQLSFVVGDGTNTTTTSCSIDVTTGKWMHIACTYEGGTMKMYLDGALAKTFTTTIVPKYSLIKKFMIGTCADTGSYQTKCRVNDVRLHDRCLSAEEVKRIAQGLVLHYPLNDRYVEDTTNLVTGLTAGGQTTVDGDTIKTNGTSNADTYFTLQTATLTSGATYTLSCWVTGLAADKYWSFGIGAQSGDQKCGSFRLVNGFNQFTFTLPSGLNNTTQLMWDDDAYTVDRATTVMIVSNIQLEAKDHATGYTYFNTNRSDRTVYDTSGYVYNGSSISGDLAISNDTPRYHVSTNFNGTDDGVIIEHLPLSSIINTAITYAFWIKPSGETGARSVYFGSYGGNSWSIEKTTSNTLREYWNGSPDVSFSGTNIKDDEWQHIVITKNGTSDIKVYINGELRSTSTATHADLSFPTTYRIGRDIRSGDGTPYKGLMSDFRIYATALSEGDVKELYEQNATVT